MNTAREAYLGIEGKKGWSAETLVEVTLRGKLWEPISGPPRPAEESPQNLKPSVGTFAEQALRTGSADKLRGQSSADEMKRNV